MNTREDTVRLATRGSDLALRQANRVKERLETRRRAVELVEVETTGDQLRDDLIRRLGKTGAFVHALDEAVPSDADGRVLKEIFHSRSKPGRRAVSQRDYGEAGSSDTVEADFDDVEDRLRGLGYME